MTGRIAGEGADHSARSGAAAGEARSPSTPLLSVEHLSVGFRTEAGVARVVDDLSLAIESGKIVGLVGESGCGKSVTAKAIMRLLPMPPARIEAGCIRLEGQDLLTLDERAMRAVRGNRIGMIFQEPMTSLNPTFPVGFQIGEALRLHRPASRAEAREHVLDLLRLVGIGAPARRLAQYPHELSGGLRQRVMIAMALACRPKLLIADEPTTALDVTIQAQILELLLRLRDELGMAILLITHDLGVVAEYADEVVVMYAGKRVEWADVRALFQSPRHPYTQGLLASMPRLEGGAGKLPTIPGAVPGPMERPPGCPFVGRCPRAQERCAGEFPPLVEQDGHGFACWHPLPQAERLQP